MSQKRAAKDQSPSSSSSTKRVCQSSGTDFGVDSIFTDLSSDDLQVRDEAVTRLMDIGASDEFNDVEAVYVRLVLGLKIPDESGDHFPSLEGCEAFRESCSLALRRLFQSVPVMQKIQFTHDYPQGLEKIIDSIHSMIALLADMSEDNKSIQWRYRLVAYEALIQGPGKDIRPVVKAICGFFDEAENWNLKDRTVADGVRHFLFND